MEFQLKLPQYSAKSLYKRTQVSYDSTVLRSEISNTEMKIILLIASFGCLIHFSNAFPSQEQQEWENYKVKFEKVYKNETEDQERFEIWQITTKLVENHNKKFANGEESYSMVVNGAADLKELEFENLYLGLNLRRSLEPIEDYVVYNLSEPAPESFDWSQKGAVTPVKHQGKCGSCYAFSAVGAIEGQLFRKTGKLLRLSEQQALDCSREFENWGCKGGFPENVFKSIQAQGGINSEESYPYTAVESGCAIKNDFIAKTAGFTWIKPKDEDQLLKALVTAGPVSVAIKAQKTFSLYANGVYDDSSCTSKGLSHAVLLVGYGKENGKDYWLIKNSWVSCRWSPERLNLK